MYIDAILPIHPLGGDKRDLLRAAALLQSLQNTGFDLLLGTVFVVVPKTGLEAASALANAFSKVTVVSEAEFFSNREQSAMEYIGGWHRQQLIKLSGNRLTNSTALITLDSDVVCLRAPALEDIYRDGRILFQPGLQFETWRFESAKLIGATPSVETMGVTPAILHAGIMTALQGHLQRGTRTWIDVLSTASLKKKQWTEYMLYQTCALRLGLWENCHFHGDTLINSGIWKNTKVDDGFFEALRQKDPLFLVVQSLREDFEGLQAALANNGITSVSNLSSSLAETLFPPASKSIDNARQVVSEQLLQSLDDHLLKSESCFPFLEKIEKEELNRLDTRLIGLITQKDFLGAARYLRGQARQKHCHSALQELYCETLASCEDLDGILDYALSRANAGLLSLRTFHRVVRFVSSKHYKRGLAQLFRAGQRCYPRRAGFFRIKAGIYQLENKPQLAWIAARTCVELQPENDKYRRLLSALQPNHHAGVVQS